MTEEETTTSEAVSNPESDAMCAPGMDWYVLRVASNKEEQVRDALDRKVKIEGMEERVGRILVPTLKEKRMRGGVLRVVERKLYPGYVFVEMACEDDGSVGVGIEEAVWLAMASGAVCVSNEGAQESMGRRADIDALLATRAS